MGVLYSQSIGIVAGKQPDTGPVREKLLEIPNYETITITDWGEATAQRFLIPNGSIDMPLSLGTISNAEIFVMRVDTAGLELDLKLINTNGTSMNLPLLPSRTSIFHTKFIGALVTNTSGGDIEGVFFVAGD